MKKQVPFNNTNLNITSKGHDKNGNYCIGLRFNNNALSFSIQTNGNLRNTENLIKGKDLSKLTEQDLLIIENEVVNYIKKHGSPKQKKSLKTYFNEMNSGDINVYDAPGGGIDWSEDLNKNYEEKMIKEQKEITLKLSDIEHTRVIKWMNNNFDKNQYDIKKDNLFYKIKLNNISDEEIKSMKEYLKKK